MNLREYYEELKGKQLTAKEGARNSAIASFVGIFIALISNKMLHEEKFSAFRNQFSYLIPYAAVIAAAVSAVAAIGLYYRQSWGKRAAQLSSVFFCLIFVLFFMDYFYFFWHRPVKNPLIYINIVFGTAILVFCVINSLFYIRMINKIDLSENASVKTSTGYQEADGRGLENAGIKETTDASGYHYSFFRFSTQTTMFIMVGPLVLLGGLAFAFATEANILSYWIPIMFGYFIFMFTFLAVGNFLGSPFQRNRKIITSFIGGGDGKGLINATVPFYRLLVYEDSLELRFMFNCYLIPYKKIDSLAVHKTIFTKGLEIKSSLPGVPTRILFLNMSPQKTFDFINNYREKHINQIQSPRPIG